MKIREYIQVKGNPDPATYCPANGYVEDTEGYYDPEAAGWILLAEFQTNSGNSTTFDPSITADSGGDYRWYLGDGAIMNGQSISYTYLDTTTKTVQLWGKGTLGVTRLDLRADNIVGELDISHSVFQKLTHIYLFTNSSMTNVVFPSSTTGSLVDLYIHNTGINTTLDLSMFDKFNNAWLYLYGNSSMTGITFTSSTSSGSIQGLYVYSTGVTGTLDLSGLSSFTSGAGIFIFSNSSLTGLTFASSISGTIANLQLYLNNITGTLDLSKFTTFSTFATIYLHQNASMTGVTFASSITGTINYLNIYSTGITGTLDLSMFTTYLVSATLNIYSNTSMTGVTFPGSTITGLRTLQMYSNTSLGYVDLTKLNTGVNSISWSIRDNGWSAAIVNQVLAAIDSISGAGYTGRIINIGGTNADPDGTSGGYDGTAARNQLISDGFTVTIT